MENETISETFCLELVDVLEKRHFQLSVSEFPDLWKCLAWNLKLPPLNVHQQQSVNRRVFELLLIEKLTPCVHVEDQDSERGVQRMRTSLSHEESIAV